MKTQTHSGSHPVNRRQFFRRLAALSGGVIAAGTTAASAGLPPQAQAVSADPQSGGYRLTDHIRKYYRKAAGASPADPIWPERTRRKS